MPKNAIASFRVEEKQGESGLTMMLKVFCLLLFLGATVGGFVMVVRGGIMALIYILAVLGALALIRNLWQFHRADRLYGLLLRKGMPEVEAQALRKVVMSAPVSQQESLLAAALTQFGKG